MDEGEGWQGEERTRVCVSQKQTVGGVSPDLRSISSTTHLGREALVGNPWPGTHSDSLSFSARVNISSGK